MDDLINFPYYKRVPADDSIINMNNVVDYFNKCYYNKNANDVATTIRELSQKHFDFVNAFKPVVDFVKSK